MKVTFNNIKITGFLSIGEAEVDLTRSGYVLISGKNNNPVDHALSNGSGKSSLLNAICWTITGETIKGLSKNIPNQNTDTGCKCELSLTVDGNDYVITRYRDYNEGKVGKRTDLKILLNGKDVSGKGIKESEAELAKYLPDLTSEFLGSVILLGQGLPHKFTDNTPAKRKELLETLSKTDFMLNDLRTRLARRTSEVEADDRAYSDRRIELEAKITTTERTIESLRNKLSELDNHEDWDKIIEENSHLVDGYVLDINKATENLTALKEQREEANKTLLSVNTKLNEELQAVRQAFDSDKENIMAKRSPMVYDRDNLKRDIDKITRIPDICPTCGQKMPADKKPDIKPLQEKYEQLNTAIELEDKNLRELTAKKDSDTATINEKYVEVQREATSQYNKLKYDIENVERDISTLQRTVAGFEQKITKAKADKANFESRRKELEDDLSKYGDDLRNYKDKQTANTVNIEKVTLHLSVLKKMDTALRRDFRGYLLSNVIKFIDQKAKEYSKLVFKTDKLDVILEGNNINIQYCDKDYENLSGGEEQKVDIIIQFAIRDMLCKYLNFSSNILAFDELFDNLDELGTQEVLNLIAKKLTDVESVYIISHHGAELQVPYDYEIIVEKDEHGVSTIR